MISTPPTGIPAKRSEPAESVEIRPDPAAPGTFLLRTATWLPAPIADVFDFFADAFRLQDITPAWLDFRVTTPPPIAMRAGTLIDYRLRLHGWPIRWRTEIVAWEPPHRFVDVQLRGPYRLWHHEHAFVPSEGGTRVDDLVRYRVPGGRLVERLFVRRDLVRIFAYRRQRLLETFGARAAFPDDERIGARDVDVCGARRDLRDPHPTEAGR
jgi:ligand-binding SRPBCC domain-containing protein